MSSRRSRIAAMERTLPGGSWPSFGDRKLAVSRLGGGRGQTMLVRSLGLAGALSSSCTSRGEGPRGTPAFCGAGHAGRASAWPGPNCGRDVQANDCLETGGGSPLAARGLFPKRVPRKSRPSGMIRGPGAVLMKRRPRTGMRSFVAFVAGASGLRHRPSRRSAGAGRGRRRARRGSTWPGAVGRAEEHPREGPHGPTGRGAGARRGPVPQGGGCAHQGRSR